MKIGPPLISRSLTFCSLSRNQIKGGVRALSEALRVKFDALTSNQSWVGPQAPQPFIYPFVYQPTCTTLGVTRACNQMNEQGEQGG